MHPLRELICGIVESQCKSDRVAVLLSGGIDSMTCAFAAQATGKDVVAYAFQVGEWESEDSASARQFCNQFGWEFNLVRVPIDNLEQDFLSLAEKYQCRKKTQFECTFPFMHLFPEIEPEYVLSGLGADGHCGLGRRVMTAVLGEKGRRRLDTFDDLRTEYFNSENPGGIVQLESLAKEHGRTLCTPYRHKDVFNYFIGTGWEEINRPLEKYPILLAFRDEFKTCGYRKHANLQIVSGIDRVFEGLLSSDLNTKGRGRVMDLCRDYAWKNDGS